MSFKFVFIILFKLLVGKKPPEEIIVIAKLKESNDLIFDIFKKIKIKNVRNMYKKKILTPCLNASEILNDKKFVKDFFRLISNMSIKRIIENKK